MASGILCISGVYVGFDPAQGVTSVSASETVVHPFMCPSDPFPGTGTTLCMYFAGVASAATTMTIRLRAGGSTTSDSYVPSGTVYASFSVTWGSGGTLATGSGTLTRPSLSSLSLFQVTAQRTGAAADLDYYTVCFK